jgi:hypothetical protein
VASSTVQHSFPTEQTCNNNGKILLAKFIPKGTGEMIISCDYMRTSTAGNVTVTIAVEDSTVALGTLTGLDWRTPIGTSLSSPTGMNMGTGLGTVSSSTYTTNTKVLTITNPTPIYIYGSMSSGTTNAAFFKNVTISYDVITGGA